MRLKLLKFLCTTFQAAESPKAQMIKIGSKSTFCL